MCIKKALLERIGVKKQEGGKDLVKKKKVIWTVLGMVIIASFAFSFLVFREHNLKQEKYLTKSDVTEKKPEVKENVINENTEIVTKVIYEQTGQQEVTTIKPTQDMLGLTKKDLQEVYNGWIIEEFSPNKVQLTLRVKKQAEGLKKPKLYLGIKNGYVAVFQEPPGPKAKLKQLTKIPVKSLPEQEAKDLEKGIQVKSEEEMLEILEGLSSYGEY